MALPSSVDVLAQGIPNPWFSTQYLQQGRSELLVLDSQDVAAGPVATVTLPGRVPHGFHGTWVPADG